MDPNAGRTQSSRSEQGPIIVDVEVLAQEARQHRAKEGKNLDDTTRAAFDIADLLDDKGAHESAANLRRGALPPKTFTDRLKRFYSHEVTVGDMLILAISTLAAWGIVEFGLWAFDKPGLLIRKGGTENLLETSTARRRVSVA